MQTQANSPQGLPPSTQRLPLHVAFIMDGNGRWATQQGLPRLEGHRVGVNSLQTILQTLAGKGVKWVTVYAFSTENWSRPTEEVDGILALLDHALQEQTQELHKNNIRVIHIGRLDRLPQTMRDSVEAAQRLTINNTGITLNVAFDYGGREEILDAVKRIIKDGVSHDQVDESLFKSYLYTSHAPDPDLIIRTGGELRISNFLLWQSAYSEYYHTPTFWPDLDAHELNKALDSFANRKRRLGNVDPEE